MPKALSPFARYALCIVVTALLTSGAWYHFAVQPGNRAVAEGLATASQLEAANAKLSGDLADANSSVKRLTDSLADRQRVINDINSSVKQLGSGLDSGIATLDQVIESIQNVIGILQNG